MEPITAGGVELFYRKFFMPFSVQTVVTSQIYVSPLVLVAEDEPMIALELEDELLHFGFRVLGPAFTIRSALRLLQSRYPDVAVLDYSFQGEDVAPVAIRLKELGIPFVLSSANDWSQITHPVFSDIENLGKPMRPADLKRALLNLLAEPIELQPV